MAAIDGVPRAPSLPDLLRKVSSGYYTRTVKSDNYLELERAHERHVRMAEQQFGRKASEYADENGHLELIIDLQQ